MLIVAGFNLATQADTIQGSIDFDGGATLNGPLSTATSFLTIFGPTGTTPIVINGSQTLDYSGVPGGIPATFNTFAFNGTQSVPFTLWSFSVGTTNYSFEIDTITNAFQSPNFLDIVGAGTAKISGFTDTPGMWTITSTSAHPNAVRVTFSSSVEAVPEPASIAFFTTIGLGALVLSKRFTRNRTFR